MTGEGKILQRKGSHNLEAMPALIQVQKLEVKKMEEILKNPDTARVKMFSFQSQEILNPEMAAFASSYKTIQRKLHRRLKKMKEISQWSTSVHQAVIH